jgi:hypothetical protein
MRWKRCIIIPRSGVMRTQLEKPVTHENITIHIDSIHMASNIDCTVDPCEYISNNCSWPWIGNIKWTHSIGYHSHEQGTVEFGLKFNWRYMYTMEYNMIFHDHWSHIGIGPMKDNNNYEIFLQWTRGLLHYRSRVQVYIMWIKELKSNTMRFCLITVHWGIPLIKGRQPTNNENRCQGIEYIPQVWIRVLSLNTWRIHQSWDINVFKTIDGGRTYHWWIQASRYSLWL